MNQESSGSGEGLPLESGERRGARSGLWLFAAYLLLYGGFVALCTFAPAATSKTVLWGVNLAVLYGMGLIIAAVLLALVYAQLCRSRRGETIGEEGGR